MVAALRRLRFRLPSRPDNLWVIITGALFAALMGSLASVGVGVYALGFVLAVAAVIYAFARPEHAAIGLIFLLPYMVVPLRLGEVSLFLGMPLALVIGISLLLRASRSGTLRQPKLFVGLFLLLILAMVIATIASPNALRGVTRIVYVLIYGIFAAGIGTAIASGRLTQRSVGAAFVGGAAVGAIGLLGQSAAQFVVGEGTVTGWLRDLSPWFHGNAGLGTTWHATDVGILRAIFPFMTPPSAGQYMAVALIGAAWFLFNTPRRIKPREWNLSLIALLLIAGALLMTFSRQAWIGAAVGMVVLVLSLRTRRTAVVAAAIPFLLVLSIAPVPGGNGSFYEYIADSADSKSADDRVQLWSQAIGASRGNLADGVGPGQYSELSSDPTRAYYAHNMYLDQLVELGLAGGVLFLGYGLILLGAAWRRRATLALSMLTAFMVANIFDDTFYSPRNGLALAVIVALVAVPAKREERAPPPPRAAVGPEPRPSPPALVRA